MVDYDLITLYSTCRVLQSELLRFRAGVELRGGVNPLKDRLKLDTCVTRAMQVVMKLVRIASNRHLRNWEVPTALVQEIIPVAS